LAKVRTLFIQISCSTEDKLPAVELTLSYSAPSEADGLPIKLLGNFKFKLYFNETTNNFI